jgi:hypothetical protein
MSAFGLPMAAGRVVAVLGAVSAGATAPILLPMSPYKDLPATVPRAVLETCYDALGRVDLVLTPALHHAPGLSLEAVTGPPRQAGLFVDGHFRAARDLGPPLHLESSLGALPAHVLGREPRALLLGVGSDLARASHVVEPNGALLRLSGAPGTVAEPRRFLECLPIAAGRAPRFDVVLLEIGAGDPALETPLLTVDGLAVALGRVGPRGAVAATAPLATPPRQGLRLLLTAERVTPHVVAARSSGHLCVVLLRAALDDAARERVRAFADAHGFDVVRPRNLAADPPFHARDIALEEPDPAYPYDVRPVTDARPYFHRHFRWARLGDLFDSRRVPYVEWPFVAILVGFLQVAVASVVLLFGPLVASRAARAPAPLFLALGVGYMALEMAFLSRATVLLGGPAPAAACVVGGFLLGSGLGSATGVRLGRPIRGAALAALLLAVPAWLLLPATPLGIALVVGVLAFPLGMPFPYALGRLAERSVPWALAANGCASVVAAAGAPLLSTTFGVPATLAVGLAGYLAVALGLGKAPPTAP